MDERAFELAFWNSVQSSNDCGSTRAYLQRFPNGVFAELARLAERRLCGAGSPVAATNASSAGSTAPVAALPPSPSPPPSSSGTEKPASVVAALPAATPSVADPATTARPELARNIQLELIRLGCFAGEADGNWSAGTRQAVARINKAAKVNFDANTPSATTLATLQKRQGRAFAFYDLSRRRDLTSRVLIVETSPVAPEARDHMRCASVRTWDPKQSPTGEVDFASVRADAASLPERFPGLVRVLVDEGAEAGSLLPFARNHPRLATRIEGFVASPSSNTTKGTLASDCACPERAPSSNKQNRAGRMTDLPPQAGPNAFGELFNFVCLLQAGNRQDMVFIFFQLLLQLLG
jgi:hypothetical protein